MLQSAIPLAAILLTSPALAFDTSKLGQGGSLPLSDLDRLLAKSPQLQRGINQAPTDGKKAIDDVICGGMRFPGQWQNLGGRRVGPYTCNFETKLLQIKTKVRITGRKGAAIDAVTPAAMRNADKIIETNPTWTWTTGDPSAESSYWLARRDPTIDNELRSGGERGLVR